MSDWMSFGHAGIRHAETQARNPRRLNTLNYVRTPATVGAAPGHGQKPVRDLTVTDVIEEWRPVVGFEDSHEVSSLGRVRSVDRWVEWTGRTKPRFCPGVMRRTSLVKGYPHLMIKRGSFHKNLYVHSMVCEAFYGPRPSPAHDVRHLNGNPLDNRLENLAWGTKSENFQDQYRHGSRVRATGCAYDHGPYDYVNPNTGERSCRTCTKAAIERHRRRTIRNPTEESLKSRMRRVQAAIDEGRTPPRSRRALYNQLEVS